ncbi:hypothetical protein [Eudoraea sp.]|uniref:hypothetical protein n=1 Tax=Eudoraea sp. TaxID=1979955 RepID=UPI003C766416
MKTTNLILILMAVMGLMSCGQLHVVTLYVDTTQIDQSSIDQHASFGQLSGIPNNYFTTNVRKGDRIIWQGVSISNPSDTVKITSIDHVSGARIYAPKSLKRIKRGIVIKGTDEIVVGTIKIGPGGLEQYIEEKYSLDFTVTNKGTFIIDPKIRSYK